MHQIVKHSVKHTIGQALNVIGLVQATGVHKPFIRAAKSVHRVATHPATQSVAKVGWCIGVTTGKTIYKVATHPTTAYVTHKAWLHGTKAARHTGHFMAKVAAKGFKLRT